ncbi:MAG: c-type cytochrome, partial [Gemmatimonadetes bacterium]|nr:c-type cytochrome [Gemmatimonadota bacterium]
SSDLALGIAADGKWDSFLPAWRQAVGEGWKTKAGRDIVWRARTESALPLLEQLIQDPTTAAADRERYFRALDFYRGPARERTLMSVVEASGADVRTTALALTQLDSASIRMTPQLQSAVDRTLAATRGTQQFVDIASKFDARASGPELLQLALTYPDSTKGVAAARLAVRWGGIEPFRTAVFSANPNVARSALTVLGFLGGAAAQGVIEEVILDASRPLALRQQAVQSVSRMAAGGNAPPAQGSTTPLTGDRRLLQLVQRDSLSPELRDASALVLFGSPRADVREGAARVLTAPPTSRTADGKTLPPTATLATRTGDRASGRVAFSKVCVSCHIAEGPGSDFGPALTEIGTKLPKAALYNAILEPSSGIAYNYEGWIVRLRDGRETTGIIVNDTQTELAVKVMGGIVTRYPRADVASVTAMPVSLMPKGLHTALTEQELVDLVEYLSSLRSPTR